ncbi:ATP-binding protein [Microcoleus sp. FACHB-53]|nr:ATP-binding protein [Microcoleus sp. FACHB-53]
MSKSNAAIQPPEEEPRHSPQQKVDAEGAGNTQANVAIQQPGQQPSRSPEQQAEVERIGRIETYVGVQRDQDLFDRLDYWRDLKICARVTTFDRLGLSKALDYYTKKRIKRRGDFLQLPAPVAYIEMEQHGSPTDLFLLILEFLSNPFDCRPLRDLRARTWGTLKGYGVKILIVNQAELLSFAAFNELVRISEKLKISVILTGPPYLNDILDPNSNKKKRYINIHNTFLKYHPFNLLSQDDTATVIGEWEKSGLKWTKPLKLDSNAQIVALLHEASQGQLRPLYEHLREIAIWRLDHPKAQINPQNISQALGIQFQPISKLKQV